MSRQAVRSRRLITEGLLKLMERDDYSLVTITQICQESRVARQTFYRNFDSKQDVLESYISDRLMTYANENRFGGNFESNLHGLFADFPIPRAALSAISRNGLMHLLESDYLEFMTVVTERIDMPKLLGSSEYDDYLMHYIVSTVLSILSVWIKHGYKESAQELSAISIELFRSTAAQ